MPIQPKTSEILRKKWHENFKKKRREKKKASNGNSPGAANGALGAVAHPRGRRGRRLAPRRRAGPLFQNAFAIFWRARSRLYQTEILQENMRLTAFFKLYKICILLHRRNLKMLAKNRFEKSAIFVKIQQHFANFETFAKILLNFRKKC